MNNTNIPRPYKRVWALWVPLTLLFGPFNFLLFAYAGFRSKDRKLVYISYIYAIPVFLESCYLGEIAYYVTPFTWIGGFIHALLIRKSYINRRMEVDMSKRNRGYIMTSIAGHGQNNFTGNGNNFANHVNNFAPGSNNFTHNFVQGPNSFSNNPNDAAGNSNGLIDINNCGTEELMKLPFMTEILAKQAVVERETRQGFKDIEEFGMVLGLKPHMVERIRPLVVVGERTQNNISLEKGRVLDL